MTVDIEHLRTWIGRIEQRTDPLTTTSVEGLLATLDRQEDVPTHGDAAPLGTQWLYVLLPMQPQSKLGEDGHPRRGGFLPPVELQRRMWAGGDVHFVAPLVVGPDLVRSSSIEDVVLKQGNTGPLVFVTVKHQYTQDGQVRVIERQDVVYRDDAKASAAGAEGRPASRPAAFTKRVQPTPTLLFRYSALSQNGHRIHYDRPYAQEVEGYAGLVVHGPLVATYLLDLMREHAPEQRISRFKFRGVRPLIDTDTLTVCGAPGDQPGTVELWAHGSDGFITMTATVWLG